MNSGLEMEDIRMDTSEEVNLKNIEVNIEIAGEQNNDQEVQGRSNLESSNNCARQTDDQKTLGSNKVKAKNDDVLEQSVPGMAVRNWKVFETVTEGKIDKTDPSKQSYEAKDPSYMKSAITNRRVGRVYNRSWFSALQMSEFDRLLENSAPKRALYSCNLCDYDAYYESQLKRHVDYLHSDSRLFKCKKCNFKAKRVHQLRDHQNSVHFKLMYSNTHDYLADKKMERALDSLWIDQNTKKPLCRCVLSNYTDLQKDVDFVHLEKENLFKCSHCDCVTNEDTYIRVHIQAVHRKGQYKCEHCDFDGVIDYLLLLHQHLQHPNIERKPFKCVCGADNKTDDQKHMDYIHLKMETIEI